MSGPRQMIRQQTRNSWTMRKAVGLEAARAGRKGWRMRKGICGLLLLPVALAGLLGISSCGGAGAGTVTSVTIAPTTVTVQINETAEFTATVAIAGQTSTSETTTIVTWYVNGVAGGNSTTGTIGTSTLDQLVGIYPAPATVPDVNSGQVNITATTPQVPGSTTNTNLITSNTAVVTIGIGTGLSVSPLTATVFAGQSVPFAAILNNVTTTQGITWTVSSTAGGNIGTISPTGFYTAPPSPPPGNTVTITAEDTTTSTTATATISFSNVSLTGPFAFSYS